LAAALADGDRCAHQTTHHQDEASGEEPTASSAPPGLAEESLDVIAHFL
jgi:hypothetical protein